MSVDPSRPLDPVDADLQALYTTAMTIAERLLRLGDAVMPALLHVDAEGTAAVVDAADTADDAAVAALLQRAEAAVAAGSRAAAVVFAADALSGVEGFDEAIVARLRGPGRALRVLLPHRGDGDELEIGRPVALPDG